jgi:hypothetical protein
MPTKMTSPIVPPTVISPTRSLAFVRRPCALALDVAAMIRIASRPPSPRTRAPAIAPAPMAIAVERAICESSRPAAG